MIAVVQRVSSASVSVGDETIGQIGHGLLVLLGVEQADTKGDADYLAKKIVELRIFQDDRDKMNLSLLDTGGEMLIVSQFTLLADCRKGKRPSFNHAAEPEKGNSLYEYFVDRIRGLGVITGTGNFGSMMAVSLTNDGPVTIIVESRKNTGERHPLQAVKINE